VTTGRDLGPTILPYNGTLPRIAADAFVAAGCCIVGDVTIEAGASVWFNCVVRGDERNVTIGARTNIQDGTVIHVHSLKQGTYIGRDVTVGHMALLHACTVEDGGFVGMGAVVLDGAVVEGGGLLAAGALLAPGKRVPAGELWAGRPARFVRKLTDEERAGMVETVDNYAKRAQTYLKERQAGA
jgi:carbonic anhydrase/acetyltransferase-like protein (isoleucine patch superfamily)